MKKNLGKYGNLSCLLFSQRDARTLSRVTVLRAFALIGILAILIAGSHRLFGGVKAASAAPIAAHNQIVLAELFTSEGCSSCPPADELLSRLVQQQPIQGVTVLALSEHVDYWNRLGWVDPFSSPSFSNRQSQYAAQVFRAEAYTPQLVIDGSQEAIGSDAEDAYRKIAQAAKIPKASVKVFADLPPAVTTLQITIKVDVPREVAVRDRANVMLAITENNLASDVRRGENSGHLLRHTAVVRRLQTVGDLAPSTRTWSKAISVQLGREWKPEDLRIIGFLQEQQDWHIIGAGSSRVENPAVK